MPSFVTLAALVGVFFNKATIPAFAVSDSTDTANAMQLLTIPRIATPDALSGTLPPALSGASPLLRLSPSDPPTPYAPLSFNVTVAGGETFTYISARPPEGCEPEINGTFVDMKNVSFTSTKAVCDDDHDATVGLYMFGDDAYLLRSGNPSVADSLYQCINITGYDGPPPPHVVRIRLFDNGIRCTVAPTTATSAPSAVPEGVEVLPKVVGVGVGVLAFVVCGGLVIRRMHARQVHPEEAQAPASDLEMAPMRTSREREPAAVIALTD